MGSAAPSPKPHQRPKVEVVKEIREAIAILISPSDPVEIRTLLRPANGIGKAAPMLSTVYRDHDEAARHAATQPDACEAVYVTLNPFDADKIKVPGKRSGAVKDEHITRRRWLLVDCDPDRTPDPDATGDGKLSASDNEKDAARELAVDIIDAMQEKGWPRPVFADSGNGFHLLYRIDLPNDDESKDLVRRVLHALGDRFDHDQVKVDRSVFNAGRITKMYGTIARKGVATTDRPHRPSKILDVPSNLGVVTREQLEALAPKPLPAPVVAIAPTPMPPRSRGRGRLTIEERAIRYVQVCDPAISGHKGHNKAFSVACKVGPGFNLTEEQTFRILMDHWNERCNEKWSDSELRHKISDAFRKETRRGWFLEEDLPPLPPSSPAFNVVFPPTDSAGAEPPEFKRVEVEVTERRHEVFDAVLDVLRHDPDLYRRGLSLVRVSAESEDTIKLPGDIKLHGAKGTLRVATVGQLEDAGLSCRLTRLIDFYTMRADRKGELFPVPAHPPTWLMKAILAHGEYPGVRELRGVAETPFPRADGSLVTKPGWDPTTRFFLSPNVDVGSIPAKPTQAEAKAAAESLLELVEQFPFVGDGDRAVWLAGLLTVLARPGIEGPVPGVAMVSNRAGTGKGKLVDIIGVIATGRPVPTSNYPKSEEEAGKVKTSLAIAAAPIVHLDNVPNGTSYGSGGVDSMLTSTVVNDRVLGQSKLTGNIELRCSWFLSGNNVAPSADAFRRWLVVNLSTPLESPEERGDLKHPDLLGHVLANRPKYVRAALIILRAHSTAGFPSGWAGRLGSFEEWDRVVRGAVWHATGLDCNVTRRQAAIEAPERLSRIALLESWRDLHQGSGEKGGLGRTAEDAHKMAVAEPEGALAAALMRNSRDGKLPAAREIGNLLRKIRDVNIGGMMFKRVGESRRSALWRVDTINTITPDSRKSGSPGDSICESRESCESFSYTPTRGLHSHTDVNTGNTSEWKRHANNGEWRNDSQDSQDSQGLFLGDGEQDEEVFDL